MPREFGPYTLEKKIAQGGMAEIFLARRRGDLGGFEKRVAIKRIFRHLTDQDETVRMFFDEARIAASLNHPNIVQIYDLGEEEGHFYIAMEFVQGTDLRRVCKRGLERDDYLSFDLAARIVAETAAGLHYAHTRTDDDGRPRNIIHRDVSPQNVLLSVDGHVKICDFGIAKAENRLARTQTGQFKGKTSYMSPEQFNSEDIDYRSDIFNLGIVLYEVTLARRLFQADSDYERMRQIADAEVTPPSEIRPDFPMGLERIVMKALRGDPDERYETAEAMQLELENWLHRRNKKAGSVQLASYIESIYPELLEGPKNLEALEEGREADPEARDVTQTTTGTSDASESTPPGREGTSEGGEQVGSITINPDAARSSTTNDESDDLRDRSMSDSWADIPKTAAAVEETSPGSDVSGPSETSPSASVPSPSETSPGRPEPDDSSNSEDDRDDSGDSEALDLPAPSSSDTSDGSKEASRSSNERTSHRPDLDVERTREDSPSRSPEAEASSDASEATGPRDRSDATSPSPPSSGRSASPREPLETIDGTPPSASESDGRGEPAASAEGPRDDAEASTASTSSDDRPPPGHSFDRGGDFEFEEDSKRLYYAIAGSLGGLILLGGMVYLGFATRSAGVPGDSTGTSSASVDVSIDTSQPPLERVDVPIETDPEGAAVVVNGMRTGGRTPGSFSLVAGRPNEVILFKEGFHAERAIVPSDDHERLTSIELEEIDDATATGTIRLQSEPSGAMAYLDGRRIGTTPVTVEDVSAESLHHVRFDAKGRHPFVGVFDIFEGRTNPVVGRLARQRRDVDLKHCSVVYDVLPSGTSVRVNGEMRGHTKLDVDEPCRSHLDIDLWRANHRDARHVLATSKEATYWLHTHLDDVEQVEGTVSIDVPDDMRVYIGDNGYGTGSVDSIALPSGSHEAVFQTPERDRYRTTLEVVPEIDVRYRLRLEDGEAMLERIE